MMVRSLGVVAVLGLMLLTASCGCGAMAPAALINELSASAPPSAAPTQP